MGTGIVYLLKKRSFLFFFLTQFFGAFNDCAFKLAMLTLISYYLASSQMQSEYYQVIAGALFIIPFCLFSATGGQLADKYDKSILIRLIKVFEVFLMITGGFMLYYGNIFWMMCILTGMGIHSSLFGPIKYSILPEHLAKEDLLGATGLIDGSTFIAILLGTTLGTLSVSVNHSAPYLAIFMLIFVAILGLISSLFIPRTPPSSPNLKIDFLFWRSTYVLLKQGITDFKVFFPILVISWFWLAGSIMLTKLPDYTNFVLGANDHVFALFLSLFSIGLAAGSVAINYIFRGQVVLSIVPWAMLVFSFFISDIYWATPNKETHQSLISLAVFFNSFAHWRIAFDLLLSAFCGGLFLVPLYTYLQIASDPKKRARVIAVNNICNSSFMVLGALMIVGLLHLNVPIAGIFLIVSVLNIGAAFLAWLAFRTKYFKDKNLLSH